MFKPILTTTLAFTIGTLSAETRQFTIEDGECWWGLETRPWANLPFDSKTVYATDLAVGCNANQAAPVLVSTHGRFIWCDEPFACAISNGSFTITAKTTFDIGKAGPGTLRAAFLAVAAKHFPASGKCPPEIFVAAPQYNTWIELTYHQNEKDLLQYAQSIVDLGFPPGILMVDDTWQAGYGTWEFDTSRFDAPKAMCDRLHAMGFKLMLWVAPFVSLDSPVYRDLAQRGAFLRHEATDDGKLGNQVCDGGPVPVCWWNGISAVLDLSNPVDRDWFDGVLKGLQARYGIEGFKFDAGDTHFYHQPRVKPHRVGFSAVDQNGAWSDFGLKYPFNEFRASWKHGGQPLVQRLHDKGHSWEDLRLLIPQMAAAGFLGHSFVCPDMVGGGHWLSFQPGHGFDSELFVRSAQVHALSPMMQFSANPGRVLKGEALEAVKKAVTLRQRFAPYFLKLMRESGRTGEPMLRTMEYQFPHAGFERCTDQFMMGETLLVAPQLTKGAKTRKVRLPAGTWRADDGTVTFGPKEIEVATPLDRLPHFTLVKK